MEKDDDCIQKFMCWLKSLTFNNRININNLKIIRQDRFQASKYYLKFLRRNNIQVVI